MAGCTRAEEAGAVVWPAWRGGGGLPLVLEQGWERDDSKKYLKNTLDCRRKNFRTPGPSGAWTLILFSNKWLLVSEERPLAQSLGSAQPSPRWTPRPSQAVQLTAVPWSSAPPAVPFQRARVAVAVSPKAGHREASLSAVTSADRCHLLGCVLRACAAVWDRSFSSVFWAVVYLEMRSVRVSWPET